MAGLTNPSRAIYGFVFYLITHTFFALYLLWAFIPDKWFNYIGITYLPQKYWAVVVPLHCTLILVMVPLLYFFYTLWLTPSFEDTRTITDSYAKYMYHGASSSSTTAPTVIPPIRDISIIEVNNKLYCTN